MKLILMRHGNAQNAAVDALRPLSAYGMDQVAQTAHRLKEHLADETDWVRIHHSGYMRAAQTAQIVSDVLGVGIAGILPHITPNDSPARAFASFEMHLLDEGTHLVVTHMPLITQLSERMGYCTYFDTADAALFETQALVWDGHFGMTHLIATF